MAFVERVFSGVQPTGNLHLGNYLGAIVNFVKLQQTHNCLYCVVDMHALTQPVSVWGGPLELARNTREVTAAFIASGMMAVAYFMVHAKGGFFPIINRGEPAVAYCFVFLYVFFYGGGRFSLDALIFRRATTTTTNPAVA